jgi:serine/threonine protein phosphatase PrpC
VAAHHATFSFRSSALTDVGLARRVNEDAFWVDDAGGLWMVADGVGGHEAGELASSTSVEVVAGQIRDALARSREALPLPIDRARRLVESAVQAATYMVFGMAQQDGRAFGMGTTLSVLFRAGATHCVVAQVGDSRVYRARGEGMEQLTRDHTLANWQLDQGLIGAAEAKLGRAKNVITRAVGSHDYVEVDTRVVEVEAGDRFLLCSDGLHGSMSDAQVARTLMLPGEEAVREFVQIANDRGGRDNITAVVVDVHDGLPA